MKSNEILESAIRSADEKKAENIVALNMQGISTMADYFVIASGQSYKQVQSIAREIRKNALENEYEVKRMEGFDEGKWILIDIGDVIVHVFHEEERMYYNLEKLWGDAPEVEIEKVLS
ncbi:MULTISPECIES: ribosome silencing factor [Sinobaca]|uniref:Ribosomal silencing factor RsfS n=1 Tax=Sinobaca qinghaiensis TaxID=342944 RepID=A0A419V3K2_9BACL|nr:MULTISPECIES: ribosome silencing factor [Sinobaca]RKD73054.1 ribosome-associated protein [Sinobaca qinghaiensis]